MRAQCLGMLFIGTSLAAGLSGCVFVADSDHDDSSYYSSSYTSGGDSERRESVDQTLDDLHDAASKAQEDRYFRLFTENAVFLGTDATERWTKGQFRDYAHPLFAQGKGWTYTVLRRNVFFSANRKTAWFDEVTTNEKLGECRGTGVLVRQDGRWKIAQYNLTIPVPNALASDVVKLIKDQPRTMPSSPTP